MFSDDGKIRILYTGSINLKTRNPSPLFEAVRLISLSKNSKYLERLEIIFIGQNVEILKELVHKFSVEKWVSIQPERPRADILAMQTQTSILLFLEVNNPKIPGVLTGKLFEYLNAKRPIWGIGIDETTSSGKLILNAQSGRLFGTSVELIQDALLKILTTNTNEEFTPNVSLIEQFNRDKITQKLSLLLEKTLRNERNNN